MIYIYYSFIHGLSCNIIYTLCFPAFRFEAMLYQYHKLGALYVESDSLSDLLGFLLLYFLLYYIALYCLLYNISI